MPKYRVEVILARTYGTAVIEAEDEMMARDMASSMEGDEFDTAVDYSLDVLDAYEED